MAKTASLSCGPRLIGNHTRPQRLDLQRTSASAWALFDPVIRTLKSNVHQQMLMVMNTALVALVALYDDMHTQGKIGWWSPGGEGAVGD